MSQVDAMTATAIRWYLWGALSLCIVWVDRRLPLKSNSLVVRLVAHIPISFVFICIHTGLYYWLHFAFHLPVNASVAGSALDILRRALARPSNVVYWMILAAHLMFEYDQTQRDQQLRAARLEQLLSESQLRALRSQLQPHFLFNALNAVSAYVVSNPRKARLMLEQIRSLLQLSLVHHDTQEIRLEQELSFLRRYLDLQQVRFPGRLEVRISADSSVLNALVPTFVLQPLVENAVHFGIARSSKKGAIEVTAQRINGSLALRVRNDGPGLPPGWSLEKTAGVGLTNTRARLRTLYGESKQQFSVLMDPEGMVCVDIMVPFHSA